MLQETAVGRTILIFLTNIWGQMDCVQKKVVSSARDVSNLNFSVTLKSHWKFTFNQYFNFAPSRAKSHFQEETKFLKFEQNRVFFYFILLMWNDNIVSFKDKMITFETWWCFPRKSYLWKKILDFRMFLFTRRSRFAYYFDEFFWEKSILLDDFGTKQFLALFDLKLQTLASEIFNFLVYS